MVSVDIRWRPSGGRGEYEHVPTSILLGRRITVEFPGFERKITTDVQAVTRDGKPRLRRDNANDRTQLNVAPLVAAIALLPDPIREDKGSLQLPLKDKGYVISSITFDVQLIGASDAVCRPTSLKVLHDNDSIDLVTRLKNVAEIILSPKLNAVAAGFLSLINAGENSSELRREADRLRELITADEELADKLDMPSEEISSDPSIISNAIILAPLTMDETKRKLVVHYRLERSKKIREIKLKTFEAQHGKLFCENCDFSFEKKFGKHGKGFIEVHHKNPLAKLLPSTHTHLSDLMLLCSNCHRMVHRFSSNVLSPERLREITS